MISVIIPTFNRQASTARAIESVLEQNIDVEIIVVDDGSDIPFALKDEIKDHSKIKLIRNNNNKGAGAARNKGIEVSSRPLISFLDSDDYFPPNTLKERISFALENGIMEDGGDYKIIGCSWQDINQKNEIINIRNPKPSLSPDDFFSGCWFCPGSTIIVNRNMFNSTDIRFDEDLKRLEDLDLFMRLAKRGASYEAQHMVGVSIAISDSRYPDVIIEACNDMRKKHLTQGTELDEKLQARLKSYLFYELSRAYISKHEYHKALDYLVKSFIQKPRLSLYPGPGWES